MSTTAGFVAAVFVPQAVVTKMVDAAWNVLWPKARVSGVHLVRIARGQVNVQGDFLLEKPDVSLTSSATGSVLVVVSGAGRFALALGAETGNAVVSLRAQVEVPLRIEHRYPMDRARLDFSAFEVSAASLRVLHDDGGSAAEALREALVSTDMRRLVAGWVRDLLGQRLVIPLPTDKMEHALVALRNQSLAILPSVQIAGIRTVSGWLVIGVDDTVFETHGSLLSLIPPSWCDTSHIHLLVWEDAVRNYLQKNLERAFRVAEFLTLEAGMPGLHFAPGATVERNKSAPGYFVRFLAHLDLADPLTTVPAYGTMDLILTLRNRSLAYNVNVRVVPDPPFPQDLLAWAIDFLSDKLPFVTATAFTKVHEARLNGEALFPQASVGVPDLPGLEVDVVLSKVALRDDVVALSVSVTPQTATLSAPDASLNGEIHPPSVQLQSRYFEARYKCEWLDLDPSYFVRFELRRGSTNTLVLPDSTPDPWSGKDAKTSGKLDLWNPLDILDQQQEIKVIVIVERPPGNIIFTKSAAVAVIDKFDRSNRYARWRYEYNWTERGGHWRRKRRASVIHKTRVQERCLAAAKLCQFDLDIEYLTSLPAPVRPGFSSKLCQICFPGGHP